MNLFTYWRKGEGRFANTATNKASSQIVTQSSDVASSAVAVVAAEAPEHVIDQQDRDDFAASARSTPELWNTLSSAFAEGRKEIEGGRKRRLVLQAMTEKVCGNISLGEKNPKYPLRGDLLSSAK